MGGFSAVYSLVTFYLGVGSTVVCLSVGLYSIIFLVTLDLIFLQRRLGKIDVCIQLWANLNLGMEPGGFRKGFPTHE